MLRLRPLLAAAVAAPIAIASLVGAPAFSEDFSREQIESIVREYVLANPEIITDAISVLQEREQAAAQEQARGAIIALQDELLNDPATPIAGNPSGDITIVEFFDYHCGYCKRTAPAIVQLVAEDPNLRLAMKEFPILGDESGYAARAALAANRQGLYWPMHVALMQHDGAFDETTVMALAADAGLDVEQLRTDMAAPELEQVIQANYQLAQQLGVNGTPAFVIGDQLIPGAVDIDTLRALIAQERQG